MKTLIELPPIAEIRFHHLMALNDTVYGAQNGQNYEFTHMSMKVSQFVTRATKGIRKGKPERIQSGLLMGFSWALALASRLHVNLDIEVYKKFPGVCPYCSTAPCNCAERAELRVQEITDLEAMRGALQVASSVPALQEMFGKIYPENNLVDSGAHLAEEAAELLAACVDHHCLHTHHHLDEVVLELVDVFANIFAVANTITDVGCHRLNMASEYVAVFGKGCPKCHRPSCICGYVDASADSTVLKLPA